jgi:hypothetical protein
MLQGEIHRFPTVACFRADVLIFLSFKNLTEHLAHQWIVIGDQYGPSHAAFAASRVTLALSFFLAQRISGSHTVNALREQRVYRVNAGRTRGDHTIASLCVCGIAWEVGRQPFTTFETGQVIHNERVGGSV